MKPIHKAIAGIFAATALLSGGTLAQVRYESRPAYTEAYPTNFGVIDAIDVVGTGSDAAYRIRVWLDRGNYQSFTENDLAGLRVRDRIQINNGHLFQYVMIREHYDSAGQSG